MNISISQLLEEYTFFFLFSLASCNTSFFSSPTEGKDAISRIVVERY